MRRILMVLDHAYPPDLRVENEARSLSQAGYEVTVLAIGPDDRPAEDNTASVRIVRDRISGGLRNRMRGLAGHVPALANYLAMRIASVYRSWPFDAIHAHDLYMVGGALKAARRLNVRLVADLHENWVAALGQYDWSTRFPGRLFAGQRRWETLERKWLAASDAVIVVIEEMARRLEARGIPAERISVVSNTVHRPSFDGFGIDPDVRESLQGSPVVLYTGGMDRHRGLGTVLDAMPAVRSTAPGARLVLVGDGALRADLEDRARALGVREAVDFLGRRPQSTIPSFIAGADIGLIPHVKSGHTDHTIPHKLFHCMHLGVPVVATDCEPLERIVVETGCGLVVSSGDVGEMAGAISSLAADGTLRASMGRAGRTAVEERYNWTTSEKELLACYERLGRF